MSNDTAMLNKLKKILYPAVIIIFFAFTFQSSPPGWVQQTLPRNDVIITDIYFIDSLKGCATARKYPNQDSAFILYTLNGGSNWSIQYKNKYYLTALQFANDSIGYSIGSAPPGVVVKTTNGGLDWFNVTGLSTYPLMDLFFINADTGWIYSDDPFEGGVYKTMNGGINWQFQFSAVWADAQIFFLNNDTGWIAYNINSSDGKLYRTTNSGTNWILQYSFPSGLGDVYFFNTNNGVVTSGRAFTTTNGGFNWTMSVSTETGGKMSFVNDSVGWAGQNFTVITKTLNGGKTWFYQTTNISNPSVFAIDSLRVWAGGSGIVHTTDGGGLSDIEQIGTELPSDYKLFQNYPNPFNPSTKIKFSVKGQRTNVKIIVYNAAGQLVSELVNQNFSTGTYEVKFINNNLTSGIYFYSLQINNKLIETKKMILVK